jgi:hypothetical protein
VQEHIASTLLWNKTSLFFLYFHDSAFAINIEVPPRTTRPVENEPLTESRRFTFDINYQEFRALYGLLVPPLSLLLRAVKVLV